MLQFPHLENEVKADWEETYFRTQTGPFSTHVQWPLPKGGDQPYWGLRPPPGTVKLSSSQGPVAHSLSPALPALAADQMCCSHAATNMTRWMGVALEATVEPPGLPWTWRSLRGSGGGSAWHMWERHLGWSPNQGGLAGRGLGRMRPNFQFSLTFLVSLLSQHLEHF